MLCFLLREWSNLEGPFKSKSDSVYNTFSDKLLEYTTKKVFYLSE